jgi:hypothetical protein
MIEPKLIDSNREYIKIAITSFSKAAFDPTRFGILVETIP